MSEISPSTLDRRLQSSEDSPLVLDVRPAEQYDAWHVPGSENVDVYDELAEDPDAAAEKLRSLPADREIVTVCGVGKAAADATAILREEGYEARTLSGGMVGWSRVHRSASLDVPIDATVVQVARPGTGCLSYVLISEGEAAVFDPSLYHDEYETILDDYDVSLVGVFDTHAHADHVSGGRALADRHDVPYYRHPADAPGLEVTPLSDEQVIAVGGVEVTVVHTPGHSPGSVSYALEEAALLTGDTLFHQSVGRVELGIEADLEEVSVEDNAATLYEGLQRLRSIGEDPLVLPAHDPGTPDPPVALNMSDVEARNDGLGRDRAAFIDALASDVPDHPPNFERIKRVNVGAEDVPDDELAALEQGPNNCAAE